MSTSVADAIQTLTENHYLIFKLPELTPEQEEARIAERVKKHAEITFDQQSFYMNTPQMEASGLKGQVLTACKAALVEISAQYTNTLRRTLTPSDLAWLELRDTNSHFQEFDSRQEAIQEHISSTSSLILAQHLAPFVGLR